MDDDQLEMLQRQFMSVQQEKTNPLAQRTVAQIMVKLHHEGFRFYPTTDGNEYVTPDKLDQQILTLILQRGHINIGILPQILNIGLDTIQGRVIKILTKHSSQSTNVQNKNIGKMRIFRHNNLLLSQSYLISILQNIKQLLLIEGRVNLESIAMQNQFNIKFTEKLIKQNINTLNAELHNNQLITREYNLMKKLKLLGYLRAINNPISFQNLVKHSKLSENDDNRTLQKLLSEIIEERKVKGKYQNSYYIPESFIVNQKQRILQFFTSNGFIEFQMLQKQFLVSKPEEWLQKNLSQSKQFAGKFVIFEEVCILTEKLQHYAHNIVESLNHEGFLQISHILPFTLQEKQLQKFFKDYCQMQDYFLHEGYCYSEKWIQKVMEQFKQKVFKGIFMTDQSAGNKNDPKNKKKGGKKQSKSSKLVEQDQLVQKLFNQGLAQYSVAQNIAPILVPILIKKLEEQKKKYEKQLAQNKGILNSTFLKYRSCNTIMRNIDGLQRNLNIIQKHKKKTNQAWIDKDFGPNQSDQKGIHSIIYYDNIAPKGWPPLQEALKWGPFNLKSDPQLESGLTSSNSLFGEILSTLQSFNRNAPQNKRIQTPFVESKQIQKTNLQSPFKFGFYRNQTDRRHIIVDDRLPMINGKFIGCSGLQGLAEKAYAKFRYCYKGIFNLSVKTLLLQMTGINPTQFTMEKGNEKAFIQKVKESLQQHKMIVCIAEGQSGKMQEVQSEQKIEILAMKPYLCVQKQEENQKLVFTVQRTQIGSQIKNNQGQKIFQEDFSKVFKHVYIL